MGGALETFIEKNVRAPKTLKTPFGLEISGGRKGIIITNLTPGRARVRIGLVWIRKIHAWFGKYLEYRERET